MTAAHICLVIDRSGSMQSTKTDAQGGLDSFISEFAGRDDVTVALVEFDDTVQMAVEPVLAAAWPGYTLTPRGSTALLDAMGFALKRTKKHVKANPAEKVVVVVITDGGENSSKKFSLATVTELVDGAKADGWEFLFLASDLSAIRTGTASGMATRSYASSATADTYSTLTRSVSSYVAGATSSVEWEDAVK